MDKLYAVQISNIDLHSMPLIEMGHIVFFSVNEYLTSNVLLFFAPNKKTSLQSNLFHTEIQRKFKKKSCLFYIYACAKVFTHLSFIYI